MKRIVCLLILGCMVLSMSAGCTYVKPSDTLIIDAQAGNAKAMSDNVNANPVDPNAVRQYMKANAAAWQYWSDVAHRRTPTTMPVR